MPRVNPLRTGGAQVPGQIAPVDNQPKNMLQQASAAVSPGMPPAPAANAGMPPAGPSAPTAPTQYWNPQMGKLVDFGQQTTPLTSTKHDFLPDTWKNSAGGWVYAPQTDVGHDAWQQGNYRAGVAGNPQQAALLQRIKDTYFSPNGSIPTGPPRQAPVAQANPTDPALQPRTGGGTFNALANAVAKYKEANFESGTLDPRQQEALRAKVQPTGKSNPYAAPNTVPVDPNKTTPFGDRKQLGDGSTAGGWKGSDGTIHDFRQEGDTWVGVEKDASGKFVEAKVTSDNIPLTAKNITSDSVASRIAARASVQKRQTTGATTPRSDAEIRTALSGGSTEGTSTTGGTTTPKTGPGAGRGYPSNWNVNNSPRYAPEGEGGINTEFAVDPATGASYETSPMYNWQLKEGEKNINRALRARGRSNSSFGVNQLANFYRGLGAQEEEKQYGRNWDMTLLGAQMAQAQAANARQGGMSIADLYSTFGGQNADITGGFGNTQMNNILQLAQLLSSNEWKQANPLSESAIARGENQAGMLSGITNPETIKAIMDIINAAKGNKTATV